MSSKVIIHDKEEWERETNERTSGLAWKPYIKKEEEQNAVKVF